MTDRIVRTAHDGCARNLTDHSLALSAWELTMPPAFDWHISYGEIGPVRTIEPIRLPAAIDLAPHVAFCRGTMPPYVYADWLEETLQPGTLPPEAFALLRAGVAS